MMIFDPQDEYYKAPYGAVEKGETLMLRVKVHRRLAARSAEVSLYFDLTGEKRGKPMRWTALAGEFDVWEASFAIEDYTGLVWYMFRAEGAESETLERGWRVTVYDGAYRVPDWYGGGVTYQIFPDRFARDGEPYDSPWDGERTLREDWNGIPDWKPLPNGDVKNTDFFGGNIRGIIKKLDYLERLRVKTIYLNPIFLAASNHRYDTADYLEIDPWFGNEDEFRELLRETESRGMRVMLDGVFNHTGSDSIYFNQKGTFGDGGAFRSESSEYYPWYRFRRWPDDYECWWGVRILPQVEESCPTYRDFILNKVIKKWTRLGVSGWRLDVADELPDEFIEGLNASAKAENSDAVIVGEVWEDPTDKVAYGEKRRYFYDGVLDGATNYPFRNAVIAFLKECDGKAFASAMEAQFDATPPARLRSMMNILGTHDTPRILTVLGYDGDPGKMTRDERSVYRLTREETARGTALLRLAACLQFTFPGSPCVYYGDEAGLEGFEDPFNRMTYPWGAEDNGLLDWYARLAEIRAENAELHGGEIPKFVASGDGYTAFRRGDVFVAVNPGEREISINTGGKRAVSLISGKKCGRQAPVAALGCDIWKLFREDNE